jgi:hypothetical protein
MFDAERMWDLQEKTGLVMFFVVKDESNIPIIERRK